MFCITRSQTGDDDIGTSKQCNKFVADSAEIYCRNSDTEVLECEILWLVQRGLASESSDFLYVKQVCIS
jgi:hypothetical protein